jgi:hypothetical protein
VLNITDALARHGHTVPGHRSSLDFATTSKVWARTQTFRRFCRTSHMIVAVIERLSVVSRHNHNVRLAAMDMVSAMVGLAGSAPCATQSGCLRDQLLGPVCTRFRL